MVLLLINNINIIISDWLIISTSAAALKSNMAQAVLVLWGTWLWDTGEPIMFDVIDFQPGTWMPNLIWEV